MSMPCITWLNQNACGHQYSCQKIYFVSRQPVYCLNQFRMGLFLCKLTCWLFPLLCQDVLTGAQERWSSGTWNNRTGDITWDYKTVCYFPRDSCSVFSSENKSWAKKRSFDLSYTMWQVLGMLCQFRIRLDQNTAVRSRLLIGGGEKQKK